MSSVGLESESTDTLLEEIRSYSRSFLDFFGFRENPFGNTPDPEYFFMSSQHREALTQLLFGVEQGKGFIVVTGEIGSGKTTLCRQFLLQVPKNVRTAVILNPGLPKGVFMTSLLSDFGLHRGRGHPGIFFSEMNQFLLKLAEQKGTACLIIDEAQCLSARLLEDIRLLTNLETAKRKLLQIILIGQPELRTLLRKPSLKQLRQRIGVTCHLHGFNLEETGAYMRHRLQKTASEKAGVQFGDEAVQKIFEISRGIPRLINLLCERALMAAFVRQVRRVEAALIESGAQETSLIYE